MLFAEVADSDRAGPAVGEHQLEGPVDAVVQRECRGRGHVGLHAETVDGSRMTMKELMPMIARVAIGDPVVSLALKAVALRGAGTGTLLAGQWRPSSGAAASRQSRFA